MIATEEEVIFFSPQKISVYRKNKSLKYEAEFEHGLDAVFPAGGNKYFLICAGEVQTIKLSNSKQKEGE